MTKQKGFKLLAFLKCEIMIPALQKKECSASEVEEYFIEDGKSFPHPENQCDSGVFILAIIEYLTRNVAVSFGVNHVPYFRRKIAYELLFADLLTVESGEVDSEQEPLFPDSKMEEALDDLSDGELTDVLSIVGNTHLCRRDFLTLLPGTWLNDEIMNSYLLLIEERSRLGHPRPSVYTYNTYFYLALCSLYSPKGLDASSPVLRWTKKVDVFSFDLIFVPVHQYRHWALVSIDNRSKKIQYLDSVYMPHPECLCRIQEYLKLEILCKKAVSVAFAEYEMEVVDGLPQMTNSEDCGVFMLMYAEFLSRNAQLEFRQKDVLRFRQQIAYELRNKRLLTTHALHSLPESPLLETYTLLSKHHCRASSDEKILWDLPASEAGVDARVLRPPDTPREQSDSAEPPASMPPISKKMDEVIRAVFEPLGMEGETLCTIADIPIHRSDFLSLRMGQRPSVRVIHAYLTLLGERGRTERFPSVQVCSLPPFLAPSSPADFIVLPLYTNESFSVLVADVHAKRIHHYDPSRSSGSNEQRLLIAVEYLVTQMERWRNDIKDFDLGIWLDGPKQSEPSDCGVFSLAFLECIVRKAVVDFEEEHVLYFRKKIAYELRTRKLLTFDCCLVVPEVVAPSTASVYSANHYELLMNLPPLTSPGFQDLIELSEMHLDLPPLTEDPEEVLEALSKWFVEAQPTQDQGVPMEASGNFPESTVHSDSPPNFPIFTLEMENVIKFVQGPGKKDQIFSKVGDIALRRLDFCSLKPHNYLSRSIIDSYLSLIVNRSKLNQFPTVYSFNSNFSEILHVRGPEEMLKRTRTVNLFSYDLLLVPLFFVDHWALLVIDHLYKRLRYFHVMNERAVVTVRSVRDFLSVHLENACSVPPVSIKDYLLEVVSGLPRLTNLCDSDVLMLASAELETRNAPLAFQEKHVPYFRRKISYELATGKLLMPSKAQFPDSHSESSSSVRAETVFEEKELDLDVSSDACPLGHAPQYAQKKFPKFKPKGKHLPELLSGDLSISDILLQYKPPPFYEK